MAFFAFAAVAESAASALGWASAGASAYQFIKERETAKANATTLAKQTGDALRARVDRRVQNIPNYHYDIFYTKINGIIQEMHICLSRPRINMEQRPLTFPLKNFINASKETINSSFDAYYSLLQRKRQGLESEIRTVITDAISRTIAKKERDFNRVQDWRKEATANTLTFEGDNYVSATSVYCIETLRKFYSQHGDEKYRDKLSAIMQKINTEFTNLSDLAKEEQRLLVHLIEDKAIS